LYNPTKTLNVLESVFSINIWKCILHNSIVKVLRRSQCCHQEIETLTDWVTYQRRWYSSSKPDDLDAFLVTFLLNYMHTINILLRLNIITTSLHYLFSFCTLLYIPPSSLSNSWLHFHCIIVCIYVNVYTYKFLNIAPTVYIMLLVFFFFSRQSFGTGKKLVCSYLQEASIFSQLSAILCIVETSQTFPRPFWHIHWCCPYSMIFKNGYFLIYH
jgi:hypothetical protein